MLWVIANCRVIFATDRPLPSTPALRSRTWFPLR